MKTQTQANLKTYALWIILLFFISHTNEKTLNKLSLYNKNHATTGTLSTSFDIAKACLSGMMKVVPPAFCWKAGADFGRIPTRCPNGYWRWLLMCYKNCEPGHHFILGVCYRNCEPGFANHPLSCFKHIFHWYFKHSYVPHQLTNFSHEIPCDGDMYRFLALCYRNCETIGMYNCGIGACVADNNTCALKILDMGLKTLEGIATLVTNIVTLGSSSGALSSMKTTGKTVLKTMGKLAIQKAKDAAKKAFTGEFKKRLIQKAKNTVKVMIKDKLGEFIKDKVVEATKLTLMMKYCEVVFEDVTKKLNSDKENVSDVFVSNLIDKLDVFGIRGIVDGCSKTQEDKGFACGQAVVDSLSNFDPTGLMTIASAFMHPTCDVPEVAPPIDKLEKEDLSPEEVKKYEKIREEKEKEHIEKLRQEELIARKTSKPNCIRVFKGVNFENETREDCKSVEFYDSFNDKVNSFITGNYTIGYFFPEANYEGKFIKFTPNIFMTDTKNFTHGGINLKDAISSIYLGDSNILQFKFEDWETNFMFDQLANKKLDYDRAARYGLTLKETGNKKTIMYKRQFTTNEKALALTIFIYKPTLVKIEYYTGKIEHYDTTTTLFAKDMPHKLVKGTYRTIKYITWS